MPILIFKMRPRYSEKQKRPVPTPVIDSTIKWGASLDTLFSNIDKSIEQIDKDDRYNWFYTVASVNTLNPSAREFLECRHIAFDIDGIDTARFNEYLDIVCTAINDKPKEDYTIIMSGNGLHFLARQALPITDAAFYHSNRRSYGQICKRIDTALAKVGLPGAADPSIFDPARVLRLPMTVNKKNAEEGYKKDLPDSNCFLINYTDTQNDIHLNSGEADARPDFIALPKRNEEGEYVMSQCSFLKHCKENPNSIEEPAWFAALTVTTFLGKTTDEGREFGHTISSGYSTYSREETDEKIDRILSSGTGPASKTHIESFFDGCAACPHYLKCYTPANLRGPNYIGTESTGFRRPKFNAMGELTGYSEPIYEDLVKYYVKKHGGNVFNCNGFTYHYDGIKYNQRDVKSLIYFAETHISECRNRHRDEFKSKMSLHNVLDTNIASMNPSGLINLGNGVLDLNTMELRQRTPKDLFTYVMPYNYDESADCPLFDNFIKDITLDRQELIDVLYEIGGYIVSACEPKAEKAFILYGSGANGKSVLQRVLEYLISPEAVSHVPLEKFGDEREVRNIFGKLVNFSHELPKQSVVNDAALKKIVSGESIQGRALYADSNTFLPKVKCIVSTNNMPKTTDLSEGLSRRLLLIPFDKFIEEKDRDTDLSKKLIAECPGILNAFISGYKRLKARDFKFATGELLAAEISKFVVENDVTLAYLKYNCTFDKDALTPSGEILDSYKSWCALNGISEQNAFMFSKRLKKLVDTRSLPGKFKGVTSIRTGSMRGYVGIKVLTEEELATHPDIGF